MKKQEHKLEYIVLLMIIMQSLLLIVELLRIYPDCEEEFKKWWFDTFDVSFSGTIPKVYNQV
jgi:hypothetical protein